MPRRRTRAESRQLLSRFYGYVIPYKGRLAIVLLFLLSVAGLQLVQPWLIGKIVDAANQNVAWSAVSNFLILFGAVIVFRSGAILVRNYVMQSTGMKVTCDVRMAVFTHLQKLSLRFYEERHTGRIVARILDDTSAIYNLVTGASVNLISDFITIFGVLIVLLALNWKLALVTFIVLPFFVFNYLWHRRRMRFENRRHRRNWDYVVGYLHEHVASTRLVKAFAAEKIEIDTFREKILADQGLFNQVVWRNTLLSVGAETISGIGSLLVLSYGAYLAIYRIDGFTIGQLTAFNFYLAQVYTPIVRIVDANAVIQRAMAAMEKIFTLLDAKPHVPGNDNLPDLLPVRGEIHFQHVNFAYKPHQDTLQDVSFHVTPGQMIALVGPSGAGKSTVISLLARFYDTTSGQILIDGQDIRFCNTESLRRQIGIVMQDNILFSGTIEDNIKYGRQDATDAEMIEAARAANAHEFISEFRNGYQALIGERGVQLSGGQRQRIAIARVILKNPRILIFDEATSALDTHSERLIQEATERLMKNRTSLVIAHRLSTVINADRILVMKAGRIVEEGRHEELLSRGGLYQELYNLQFTKTVREN
jgi:subfamily B ATP-binding cassette protein MsbA